MMTFLYRLMGATMLDAGTYEQIEADPRATWQAFLVVVLASLAAGVGVHLERWTGPVGFLRIGVVALITWIAWAMLTVQVGSRFLPDPQTRSDTGEMLRTIGFAAAPGLLQVFGAIPGVGLPVFAITSVWMFAAMVVAVQHALDYPRVGRALMVCAVSAVLIGAFAFGLGVLFTRSAIAAAQPAGRAPNELGRIPILEYHKVDLPEARWTRTPEHFRADLERLWKAGFRTVPLLDMIHGQIATPAGTTPLVLTFDDSSPGQFKYVEKNGELTLDPDCAVAILEQFAREHPDFGHAATFYVLPGASRPNKLFDQPATAARKLQYLASHGYEIGNHTLWHADLIKYPEATVRKQVAMAQKEVEKAVPGYKLRTLALPLGDSPKSIDWIISGSSDGVSYSNEAILKVAGGPALSPFDVTFDPLRLPRIQSIDTDLNAFFADFEKHPERRFVSDGDAKTITVPKGAASRVKPAFAKRVVER